MTSVDTVWRSLEAPDVAFTNLSVLTSMFTTLSWNGTTKWSPSCNGGTDVSTALQCSKTPLFPDSTICTDAADMAAIMTSAIMPKIANFTFPKFTFIFGCWYFDIHFYCISPYIYHVNWFFNINSNYYFYYFEKRQWWNSYKIHRMIWQKMDLSGFIWYFSWSL